MTMRKSVAASAVLVAFIVCSANASVAPDPSDSTTLVADVAEGVTETYADKIASSYTKFVKTGKGTLILTAASSNSNDPLISKARLKSARAFSSLTTTMPSGRQAMIVTHPNTGCPFRPMRKFV